MTIGKKLMISIGAMLLMLMVMAGDSVHSIASLHKELDKTANIGGRKLVIIGAIGFNTAEMLSFERGVLLRVFMKDLPKAESYHNSFIERGKAIQSEINELRPLLATERGKRDTAETMEGVGRWLGNQQEIWEAIRQGKLNVALQVYNDKDLALGKEMQKTAADLTEVQQSLFTESYQNGVAKASSIRWTTVGMVPVFLLVAGLITKMIFRMNGHLRRLALELSDGSGQIASAASQVSSSSQSLAQGSSEQAASLEETSASTEEITSMTRKNAENSKSAAELMSTVDTEIQRGNQTLEQMVASMQEINASSDKISKIIKVIDEIAFQTNILALNAAVEAARAGEAGMGFAVVADEVRNLAQRSAQAAKDTAGLIEESIATSYDGSEKLQKVADVIKAITESAAQVKTLVDEVNMGSQEQARGIDQIAKAVAQMDQVTQTTAANAEESASASEELSAQAQALQHIVTELETLVGRADGSVTVMDRKNPPIAAARSISHSLKALKSAVSLPKSKPAVKAPVSVSHKHEPNEFPLDNDFKEM